MSQETVLSLAERSVMVIIMIAGPLLLLALVIGLGVAIFQATTQIQEQTLAFIPKIVAVLVGIVIFGAWMLNELIFFTEQIYTNLHHYIG
ncbi:MULTISPECIES: flagellar biosynthesis protein FliQ [Geomicrobium]|uniref:Flagellar biosynthetic protein FliQ n=1 Tax=Geomicrobium sediminis TaxID=1347788 RepID=A0ABS2PB79_9BACL|nr:flagellar biosynthesis protein FliQ [Geomicrobium sp. JCM 19038]MBM7632606.1 flagellar biosynthetic protein FliQ [Geomicrobium sediminis]GAK07540.1 flagellar biosynthesis protein FliQ [Geomicrobium sp. JCM 19038]